MPEESKDLQMIREILVPEFLERFAGWNAEYPAERTLGLKAEYVEMHRKVMKLKPPLLDGAEVEWRESPRIVLLELIGHAFLALVDLPPEPAAVDFAEEFDSRKRNPAATQPRPTKATKPLARRAVPRLPEDEQDEF